MLPLAATADQVVASPALVETYLSWRGGAAFENLQSVHVRGRVSEDGLMRAEAWLDRSGHLRDEFDFGGVKRIHIRAPDQSWSVNPSGQLEDDDRRGPLKARRRALVEMGGALRGEDGARVVLRGVMKRAVLGGDPSQERGWAVIGISFGDADSYNLLVDPITGQLGAAFYEESGQTFFYDYADWRQVGGVRMPFWVVQGGDTDHRPVHYELIELDRPFAPSLFERPAGRRRVWAGAPVSSGWIDFTLAGAQIHIPVRVNGRATEAVLDNGAQSTVIDAGFADETGLRTVGPAVSVEGVGPAAEAAYWRAGVNIEVGALTIPDLVVTAMDMSEVSRMSGTPVPILLGDEAFAELAVDIDFAHRRLRFVRPEGMDKPLGATEIAITRNNGVDSIPVSIEGRPAIQLDVDLGSDDSLDLFPDYVKSQGLLEGRATSPSLFGGVGGIETQTEAMLRHVSLAGADLSEVPASFLPKRERATYSTDVEGAVGLQLLRRYHLIFDYPHHRLFASTDAKTLSQPFARNRLGVSWIPEGDAIKILLVAPGSPAAGAGLKVGDMIARIDGKPAEQFQDAGKRLALKQGPAGKTLTFTLTGGDVRRVTLADYY